jgi:hypothetical protein
MNNDAYSVLALIAVNIVDLRNVVFYRACRKSQNDVITDFAMKTILENGWTDLANSFFKMFVIVLIGFLSKKIGKVARKIGKFRIVKISQFDVCNKARPILTDFKRCTKCCLAINHQLFQKVTAQIPSNFTLNF